MSDQEWRPLLFPFENYQCNREGQIRSEQGRVIAINKTWNGALICRLTSRVTRTQHTKLVAPLIAGAWLGPKPAGKKVAHLNSRKGDNRVSNLGYLSQSEII